VKGFYGNFLALVRAWAYIRTLGLPGLKRAAALSVLNARYLKELLKEKGYRVPYDGPCMHEFVAQPPQGYRALDLAKGLLELGFHPPTVYFPLIVKEALMVEPTETESKETLEAFAEALGELLQKPKEWLENAPYTTPVRRLDELRANKYPKLTYFEEE
jgi:glycine dehydrogenase subunit 2